MEKFINSKILTLAAVFVFIFCISADAQKRRTTGSKTSTAKTSTTISNATAVKNGAQIISNQIKNLGQFIFVYGGSLSRIETIDKEIEQGKLSEDARKQSEIGKQGLVLTIRTFKNALLKLEDDFRAKPALRPYLLKLTGVGETAATAEEQATDGQFEPAGRTLLEVLNQLTDTLQAMP